jgi:hypothetical protein
VRVDGRGRGPTCPEAMAEAEQPERLLPDRQITEDDVRTLAGAASPHFALQLRARIGRLIARLGPEDPAWLAGIDAMAALERLAVAGEVRGEPSSPDLPPLPSLALRA